MFLLLLVVMVVDVVGTITYLPQASVIRKVEATITEELSKLKASRDKEGAAMKHAERQLSEELAKLQDAGAQGTAVHMTGVDGDFM